MLKHEPVAKYVSELTWELRGPDLVKVASGTIPQNESGTVSFTPDKDGLYVLAVTAGSCAYSIVSSTVPLAVYAGDKASFIGAAPKLYFCVPKETEEFAIQVHSAGQETVRVNVFDTKNEQVATGQTAPGNSGIEVRVPRAGRPGGVWSLETARADEGVLEDYSLGLDAKLLPCLSFAPQHVFAESAAK